jgi:hypothetical protein
MPVENRTGIPSFLPGSGPVTRTPERRADSALTRVLQRAVKWGMREAHPAKPDSCHTLSGFLQDTSALAQDVITRIDEMTSDAL